MRRGVRRPEVQRHRLEDVLRRGRSSAASCRLEDVLVGAEPALAGLVVLAQGVPDEAVVRQEAGEVRVPVEPDPHQVPGLALEPVRRGPDVRQGREARVGRRERDAQAQVLVALRRVEEGVQLEPFVVRGRTAGRRASAGRPRRGRGGGRTPPPGRRAGSAPPRERPRGSRRRSERRRRDASRRRPSRRRTSVRGPGRRRRRSPRRGVALTPCLPSPPRPRLPPTRPSPGTRDPWARPGAMTDFD